MPERAVDEVSVSGDGLAVVGKQALALMESLDQIFTSWGSACGADAMAYPPLMRVDDLAAIDYFNNFPHLAFAVSTLAPASLGEVQDDDRLDAIPATQLRDAAYALPSSACFNVYVHLRGETLDAPHRVTTVAHCYRHEDHTDGLRRLRAFSMREIVCIGSREAVLEHLEDFRGRFQDFCDGIGLPISICPSADPFFDAASSRALMSQLFPAKEEIRCEDGLPIGSLNFHRNFFGERFAIRLDDGEHAYSGCVAFGLERWITALQTAFDEPFDALLARVETAARACER